MLWHCYAGWIAWLVYSQLGVLHQQTRIHLVSVAAHRVCYRFVTSPSPLPLLAFNLVIICAVPIYLIGMIMVVQEPRLWHYILEAFTADMPTYMNMADVDRSVTSLCLILALYGLQTLMANAVLLDLPTAVATASEIQPIPVTAEVQAQV